MEVHCNHNLLHIEISTQLHFVQPPDRTAAIKCYGCTVDTCHTFDGSAAFEINCEYSTMCQKKIYPYRLNSGEQIESIQRGCANQEDKGMVSDGFSRL